MLKKIIAGVVAWALFATNPASASVTTATFLDATSGSHNGAFTTDSVSSDLLPLGTICGNTSSALTGTACVNQLEINSGGQALVLAAQSGSPWGVSLNATPSLANGNGTVPTQGGAVLSVTNGLYSNLLQGNAALSATNGLYSNLLQGNAVLSGTNPLPTNIAQVGGTALTAAVSAYGTAPTGTAVQGVNAYVTNTNANVANNATIANSSSTANSPVVNFNYGANSTNWIPTAVDSSGRTIAAGAGTAGTATGGVLTVQGVASMTPVATSAGSGAFASGALSAGSIAAGASAGDPCTFGTKVNLPISTAATTLTQIIAASGSTKIYICSIALVAPGATAFSFNTGTATNCASSTAALIGSTTAANGMSLAANGGITLGNGSGTVAVSAASSELCTLQSNAVQIAGNLTYVQQ